MKLVKGPRQSGFTIIGNDLLWANDLTIKEKGLLAVILSLPDNWKFSVSGLASICLESKGAITRTIQSLEAKGYLARTRLRGDHGQIVGYDLTVYETPEAQNGSLAQGAQNESEVQESQNKLLAKKGGEPAEPPLNKGETTRGPKCHQRENPPVENGPQINTKYISTNTVNSNKEDIYTQGTKNESLVTIPYEDIIGYLNQKTGKHYSANSKANQRYIKARWKEGYQLADFQYVIDIKSAKWLGDPKMESYLRPETLFGPKFEGYLNERPIVTAGSGYNFSGYTI